MIWNVFFVFVKLTVAPLASASLAATISTVPALTWSRKPKVLKRQIWKVENTYIWKRIKIRQIGQCSNKNFPVNDEEMIYPVCTCVAQCQSYEEDQGDEKVARTDEKSQNQVVFCPLWVEGWRSRRVRVLRYPGDWHKGKLKSTYSGPEPQIIMSPELPSRNTRSTMRPNTWRCIFWCLHIPPRKLTNSKSFIMKFLDVRLPILKSIVKCLNIFLWADCHINTQHWCDMCSKRKILSLVLITQER